MSESENEGKDNVAYFEEHKEAAKAKKNPPVRRGSRDAGAGNPPKSESFTKEQLRQDMPAYISSGISFPGGLPALPKRFGMLNMDGSNRRVIEHLKDNVIRIADLEDVAVTLCSWARDIQTLDGGGDYNLLKSMKVCRDVADDWCGAFVDKDITEFPKAVKFKGDPSYAFHCLDFPEPKPATLADCPTWAEFLGRTSNGEAFAMRVASLFYAETSRRQVVWLSGQAYSGKSTVLEVITKLMGTAYTSLDPSTMSSQFWKAPLVGKRLAIVNEASVKFLRTSAFKAITGDNNHLINEKGKPQYTARLEPIFFFASNDDPEVSGDEATLSRIIHCKIQPIEAHQRKKTSEVVDSLWKEIEAFLGYAMPMFLERKTPSWEVPCDRTTLMESVESHEEAAMDFIHANFELVEGEKVLSTRMHSIMAKNEIFLNNNQLGEWKEIWKRMGITCKMTSFEDGVEKTEKSPKNKKDKKRTTYVGLKEREGEKKEVHLSPKR